MICNNFVFVIYHVYSNELDNSCKEKAVILLSCKHLFSPDLFGCRSLFFVVSFRVFVFIFSQKCFDSMDEKLPELPLVSL